MARSRIPPGVVGGSGDGSDDTDYAATLAAANDDAAADEGAMPAANDDGAAASTEPTPSGDPPAEPVAADPPQPRSQMVPHAALHEERELRKTRERELAEARRDKQVIEERANLFLQRFAQMQAPAQPAAGARQPPEIPSIEQDPVGHFQARQARTEALLNDVLQAMTSQHRQAETATAASSMQARAAALEREFAAQTPDYENAYRHLIDVRRRQLSIAGWADPAEIQTILSNEAAGLAARALQQGRNPGEVVYELAKTFGYAPATGGGASSDDATHPPADANNASDRLHTIARGQQAARSLSRVSGQGPAPMTAEAMGRMNDAEFAKWMNRPEGRRLMG
jgi:hypothetical protein